MTFHSLPAQTQLMGGPPPAHLREPWQWRGCKGPLLGALYRLDRGVKLTIVHTQYELAKNAPIVYNYNLNLTVLTELLFYKR